LKQGDVVQGLLVTANSREVIFMFPNGVQQSYPVGMVLGIDFAPLVRPTPPPAPALPPTPPPTTIPQPPLPKPAPGAVVTIPAGTQVSVRMLDSIDGKTAQPGSRYRATVDDPVSIGSQPVIPRGANCVVEVVSQRAGEGMALRLRQIAVAGKNYSTSTEYAEIGATGTSKKRSALRRGVGLGALGAGIGAAAGGSEGAEIAAAGAGVGAASAAGAKGKQISVPTETRLIFRLTAPLPLN
jgi:hypothetical protein